MVRSSGDDTETHRAIDAVWRIESARLIAGLARIVRDVGLAEELAQDALVAALEQWPAVGRAGQPGRLAHGHREASRDRPACAATSCSSASTRSSAASSRSEHETAVPDLDAALDDDVGDDLLRLVFTACHPVLSTEARVALTLRLLGGLTTEEIARAFLVPEPTVAQRIVRAKRTLAEEQRPVRGPARRRAAPPRLSSVLEVIYLIFNEGYSATAGDDWMRPALCEDALRLGRILAELAAAGAGGPRPRRADGDPGVALAGARRARRASRSCCSTRTARAGISSSSGAASRRSSAPRSSAARAARTRCRPRSPPATPGRARRRRRTGRASPRSTTRSPSSRRRRSSS